MERCSITHKLHWLMFNTINYVSMNSELYQRRIDVTRSHQSDLVLPHNPTPHKCPEFQNTNFPDFNPDSNPSVFEANMAGLLIPGCHEKSPSFPSPGWTHSSYGQVRIQRYTKKNEIIRSKSGKSDIHNSSQWCLRKGTCIEDPSVYLYIDPLLLLRVELSCHVLTGASACLLGFLGSCFSIFSVLFHLNLKQLFLFCSRGSCNSTWLARCLVAGFAFDICGACCTYLFGSGVLWLRCAFLHLGRLRVLCGQYQRELSLASVQAYQGLIVRLTQSWVAEGEQSWG